MIYLALYIIIISVLCYWSCDFLRYLLNKKNILDKPNQRSNHKQPTPTGGGLAILFSFFMGCVPYIFFYTKAILAPSALMLALAGLTIISFRDDIREVPIVIRLISHLSVASLGTIVVMQNGSIFAGYLPYWLEFTLVMFFIAGFTNLFNFMDGIDGMTSMETIFLCLSLALVFYLTDVQGSYIYVALLLAGCTLGFAKHNWHPAKMFMGDAGSISIGFIIATLLGIWAAKGYLLQAAILPMYYFADAGVVLFFRIINLEKFWLPHSKHFFQRAVRSGFTHSQVVLKIFKYNCGLLGFCLISMWFKMINLCFLEYSIVILAMLYCYHLTKMLRMGNIIK